MPFLFSICNIAYSDSYQQVIVFNTDKSRNVYDVWYSILLWVVCFIVVLLSIKVFSIMRRNPTTKTIKALIPDLYDERKESQHLKEKMALIFASSSVLTTRSLSLTKQLNRISEDLDSRHLPINERLNLLINQSNEISITTEIINKYLT
ncbi:hypothetical protein J4050_13300 [Winogradskyella sp. DF17]|uniref:Histidine kinase n=1 Tax=Winogradskyella pelagia TaxID=2819984 RepID=A0ABS3T4Q3_9FLAO|nr:hypothetical protein [Winogradskyella sp. DF17]MBO3117727.1 hypothetical protein [Winogradskyella sp. DF17]